MSIHKMLSLRELYTVALSYADNKAKFYQIINISVKLYPVHPIANLNAAAAAIEQGDTQSISKFLSMAPHDSLAYKNCRGVYELMTGNTYEGIRMLKAAKTEGSEEASYNLNVFFENNKTSLTNRHNEIFLILIPIPIFLSSFRIIKPLPSQHLPTTA